jgi:hypothetical protein
MEAARQSLRADYARNPNPSAGVVANGSRFYLSTVGGKWMVAAGGTSSREVVSVQAPFVINGSLSPTKSTVESFRMEWADGRWRVAGLTKADPAVLDAGGTTFTSGC